MSLGTTRASGADLTRRAVTATPIEPAWAAGASAGIAGLLVFLVLHHIWIVPIWFILPIGAVVAIGGGLAVAWAYEEMASQLPRRPWTAPAIVGVIAVILLPSIVLAELRSPMFDISTPGGAVLLMSPSRAAVIFVAELLATATIMGAVLGRLIGRGRRAMWVCAVAGFVFALGPGHNIPFGGGTPAVGLEIAIMTVVVVVSAVVLVEGRAWSRWRDRRLTARTMESDAGRTRET
jgi:hypothetical protein